MSLILIIIALAAFAYLAWKNIFQASLVFIACLPLYVVRVSLAGLPSTLLELMLGVLFVMFVIKHPKLKNFKISWELGIWILIGLVSVGVAGWSLASLGVWRAYFLEAAMAFIIFANLFKEREDKLQVVKALSISAIGISVLAAYQYLTGNLIPNPFWAEAATRRATSVFPYPNAVGLYLAPIAILSLSAFVSTYKKHIKDYYLFGLGFIFSIIGIMAARSDGAIFALAFSIFILLVFANKLTRKISLAGLVLGAIIFFAVPGIKTYVSDRASLNDFSGQIRKIQWTETWKMLKDNRLVTGAGLLGYQAAVKPFHQEGFFYNNEKLSQNDFVKKVWNDEAYRESHWQPLEIYLYPHNIALNFWSELGLVGLLLFAWIFIKYIYKAVKEFIQTRDVLTLGLISVMITILIHGLVDVPYFKNDLAIMFWLIIALL